MDSILDKYKEDLESGFHPHVVLSRIYGEVFDRAVNQDTFAMFGKLFKVYSQNQILMALLDMYDMENIDHNNIYPLIVWFIKRRLERKIDKNPDIDLNSMAKKLQEEYWKLE